MIKLKIGKKTAILTLAIVTAIVMAYGLVLTQNNFVSIGAGSVVGLPLVFGMTYDPDPRRHKSRRGGLPKSLIKKYGISKKAWAVFRGARHRAGRYDPRRPRRRSMSRGYGSVGRKPFHVGSRGGVAWSGARKLRYDPTRRFQRVRRYGGRIGRGIEGTINKWGSWIGALFGLGYGVYQGLNIYNTANPKYGNENYLHTIIGGDHKNPDGTYESTRIPEIAHLWQNDGGWTPDKYLRYKFLGYKWNDATGEESYDVTRATWGLPFWVGLGAWIGSTIVKRIPHMPPVVKRFATPIGKIGKGVAIVSGIGALALPNPHPYLPMPPPPSNFNQNASARNVGTNFVPQNPQNYVYGK